MKTLGLCSDHAGYELKEFVKQILDSKGLTYKDFGIRFGAFIRARISEPARQRVVIIPIMPIRLPKL